MVLSRVPWGLLAPVFGFCLRLQLLRFRPLFTCSGSSARPARHVFATPRPPAGCGESRSQFGSALVNAYQCPGLGPGDRAHFAYRHRVTLAALVGFVVSMDLGRLGHVL